MASKRRLNRNKKKFQNICQNKVIYNKPSTATFIKYQLQEKGISVRVYKCLECGKWHLTSTRMFFKNNLTKEKKGS